MVPAGWLIGAQLLLLGAAGCVEEASACASSVVGVALTNGAATAEYLKLDIRQENAVVHVETILNVPPMRDRCSGVLIAPGWVMTAAHCAHGDALPDAIVRFGSDFQEPLWSVGASAFVHPDLDLMLLALDEDATTAIDVRPLAIADAESLAKVGDLVQVGGFGFDELGMLGQRNFLVTQVQEVADEEITVSADRLGGACFGDSGGPLLTRGSDGNVMALGVLSRGAVSCYGEDVYARIEIDEVRDWITEHLGSEPDATEDGESALGSIGRCFNSMAVWDEAGVTIGEACDAAVCGWSEHKRGFRCIERGSDPCGGISDTGECQNDSTLRCNRGKISRQACGDCGASCARSPRTGNAICVMVE